MPSLHDETKSESQVIITEDQIHKWTFSKLCTKFSQSTLPWNPFNNLLQEKVPFSNSFKSSKTIYGSGNCSSRPTDFYLPFDVKISLISNLMIVADRENFAIKFFDLNTKESKAVYKLVDQKENMNALCLEYCRFTNKEFLYVSFESKIEKYNLKELVEYSIVNFPIISFGRKKQKPNVTTIPPSIKEISPLWTLTTPQFPLCMVVRYGKYENLLYVASAGIPIISCTTGKVVQYCLERHGDDRKENVIDLPYGIDLIEEEGKACRLAISDNSKKRVAILEEDSNSKVWKFIKYIKDEQNEDDGFLGAVGLIHDKLNGQIICLDQESCRIKVYNKDGNKLIKVVFPQQIQGLNFSFQPRSLDLDYRTGILYVADTFNHIVRLFK
ncbi:predicted protein [Naegleria gruberi]|uniref:Predicted protein n=1 Tax=Naegleria gruberi TaxID=5762 RepID=D2V583_NAEGR|nr:uncharacterized protein NAEGRDRAFT_64048 [Naegleria gruberi]EFC48065.1 predicted protein [Naegleria gruberi]|eukprot:XP_002680809.1 predicted protein [Naegleria gruberi strain NEG-M]